MSSIWVVVLVCGLSTILIKGLGPVLLGGRTVPARLLGVLELLPPALLAALVVTNVFGAHRRLVVDARAVGLGVAALAVWRRLPVLAVIALAAGATATVRALA